MTKKKDWKVKKLGEVCDLIKGKKPKTFSKTGKPYLTAKSIRGSDEPQLTKEKEKVVVVNPEDIVIIMDGSNSGEMFQNLDGVLASTMGVLSFDKEKINTRFLLYFLIGYSEEFTKSRTGSAIPHLNKEQFNDLLLPIISLDEQKRIVKILDEVFADIEKAKENAEKNLENAKELFESYLQSVFENKGDDWEEKKLGEVCNVIGGGTPSKAESNFSKYYNGNIFWATVRDMNSDSLIKTEHKITKEAVKKSSTNIIRANNIVMVSRVGLGKICIVKNDTAINQDLRGIIPKQEDEILVKYLFWRLKSLSKYIIDNGSGATVHGVKLPFIKNIYIPFPKSLKTQKQIVEKLDGLSGRVEEYEAILRSKIADLEELKKSVLEKAFEGRL